MNQQKIQIKRALISVSDKTGLIEFAHALHQLRIEIISTGGTSQLLRTANIPVQDVADLTGFPEMMEGRVKTLHPKIYGGILGKRDEHTFEATQHQIDWIDLVVVNLYPFAATIQKPNSTFDEAIENIDIGGPTLIRAAAKNMAWVGVVIDPQDYSVLLAELSAGELSFATRQRLATKAFAHTAQYDAVIHHYLTSREVKEKTIFPQQMNLFLEKYTELRYGENPHQAAAAYQLIPQANGILSAQKQQGKEISYNNMADASAAVACVREFVDSACVIVKHANPCGVAIGDDISIAFQRAFAADSLSAFGGIVALNRCCDKKTAEALVKEFVEVLVAPSYAAEALTVLASKPNLRVLELDFLQTPTLQYDLKFIEGGVLIQEQDTNIVQESDLKIVTQLKPTPEEIKSLLFAWRVLKHIKSNAILLAKNNVTVGIGAGQVSRVDAVELALKKAKNNTLDAVLASDAFFPFPDSINSLIGSGVRAIIQPGGAMRDKEIIAACDELGISMVFTGKRCFKH